MDTELLTIYLKDITGYKLLSAEQETRLSFVLADKTLSREVRDAARTCIVQSNLRLVVRIATAYVNRGVELMDMIQEGNIGLMKAVDNFKPELGFKLSTYATPKIMRAITYSIERLGSTIKVAQPTLYLIQLIRRVQSMIAKKRKILPEDIDVEEIYRGVQALLVGKRTNIVPCPEKLTIEYIRLAMQVADTRFLSMDELFTPEESSRYRYELFETDEDAEVTLMFGDLEIPIIHALSTLSPKQQEILTVRFGLFGNYAESIANTASIIGRSISETRALEKEALQALRKKTK